MNKDASAKDMEKDLMFVGSVPLETSEEVFRLIGDSGLSAAAPCLPDGEVGERQYWIVGRGYRVYHGHPDIETVNRPAPINGIENWRATSASDVVTSIDFQLSNAAAGEAIDMTPGNTVIKYGDKNQTLTLNSSTEFSASNIASFGDSDYLL